MAKLTSFPKPLIGFAAYSGTGKTTLLENLVPLLREKGFRLAVVKHAHHDFDIDQPGKDSYRIRKAGAEQMLIASRQRMAIIQEFNDERVEPDLGQALAALDLAACDLVLVEGFKHSPIAKIELHRPALGKPLFYPQDENVIAVATDAPLDDAPLPIPRQLDLNSVEEIRDFILEKRASGAI